MAEVEGLHDVRMAQARQRVELALEQHGVARLGPGEEALQRVALARGALQHVEYLAHAATAEHALDRVTVVDQRFGRWALSGGSGA